MVYRCKFPGVANALPVRLNDRGLDVLSDLNADIQEEL